MQRIHLNQQVDQPDFHTLSCFITSIGKLWGDGGLADLLVDSGVYAACTVEQMLSGKQFNRAVRGLTLNTAAPLYKTFQHTFSWWYKLLPYRWAWN
jgi:hypothetical protein